MAKISGLGRGLGELLGEIEEAYDNELPRKDKIEELELSTIRANPYQPRKYFDSESLQELAESIKKHGILQPIVVKEDIDGYVLIAGERRLRASKIAKAKTIKAIIVNVSNEQMREHALIENIQRDELNSIELALAYDELISLYDITHEELADMVHKSRAHVSNTIRLLNLNDKAKKALIDNKITAGHAKILLTLEPSEQNTIINSIIGQKLSVREVEQMVKSIKAADIIEKKEPSISKNSLDFSTIKETLKELGYKSSSKERKITIEFENTPQLETFLKLLRQN